MIVSLKSIIQDSVFSLSYIKTIFFNECIIHCDKIILYNKWDIDLNTGFYKDLDTNFEQACYLSEHDFSHSELINLLRSGNIPQKQIAALKFDSVTSKEDAEALFSNLTGCDGKIREAVALKIFQLMQGNPESREFFAKLPAKTYADATIDINANICRLVVDSVKLLNRYETFAKEYTGLILQYAKQALDELDKLVFKDKKYIKNKQLFKLYWCLESLRNFYTFAEEAVLTDIMERAAMQEEYTVREKAAEISVLSDKFLNIRNQLKADSNYYVKAVFLNH